MRILALILAASCAHHAPREPEARLTAGVILALGGSAADKAVTLDTTLGPVGCVTLDAFADVLPVVARAVIEDRTEIPSFTGSDAIDVCRCVDLYGLPPLTELRAELLRSIELDLDVVGLVASSEIRDCHARSWTLAAISFVQGLADPLTDVLSRGACRVEVEGVAPDFSGCRSARPFR